MKSLNEQAADLLEAAGAVLWLPEWWTQGVSAENEDGSYASPGSEYACRFCASGALRATGVNGVAYYRATRKLDELTGGNFIRFNDLAKSNKTVARAMFRAADSLRAQA